MAPVGQFVDHHIVQQLIRQKRQLVVEIHVALRAAAAPAGLLVLYGNITDCHAHCLTVVPHPLSDFQLDFHPVRFA